MGVNNIPAGGIGCQDRFHVTRSKIGDIAYRLPHPQAAKANGLPAREAKKILVETGFQAIMAEDRSPKRDCRGIREESGRCSWYNRSTCQAMRPCFREPRNRRMASVPERSSEARHERVE